MRPYFIVKTKCPKYQSCCTETDTHPLTVIVPLHLLTCLADHLDPLALPNLCRCFPEGLLPSLPWLRQHGLCG